MARGSFGARFEHGPEVRCRPGVRFKEGSGVRGVAWCRPGERLKQESGGSARVAEMHRAVQGRSVRIPRGFHEGERGAVAFVETHALGKLKSVGGVVRLVGRGGVRHITFPEYGRRGSNVWRRPRINNYDQNASIHQTPLSQITGRRGHLDTGVGGALPLANFRFPPPLVFVSPRFQGALWL